MKLNLKPNQKWIGGTARGTKQVQLNNVADQIVRGQFHPYKTVGFKTISCKLEKKVVEQLTKIAAKHDISVQELLRQGLEQNKLIS